MAVASCLAAGASPAHAAGRLFHVDADLFPQTRGLGAPVFAGDRVAWGFRNRRADYVVTVAGTGQPSVTRRAGCCVIRGDITAVVAGSSTRVAASIIVNGCQGGCGPRAEPEVLERSAFAGHIGAALESLPGCGASYYPAVDVSGDAVAYESYCTGGITVRDFSAGAATSWRTFAGRAGRIAGPYLAVSRGPGPYEVTDTITLYDWRSGTELLRTATSPYEFDLQLDGKLVFSRSTHGLDGPRELAWVSPASPSPHRIAEGFFGPLRIAEDRVAVAAYPPVNNRPAVRILDLDGHELATSRAPRYDFDYDGQRLTWATQPCEVTAVAVWDLTGPAPRLPDGRCPTPRVRRAVWARGHNAIRLSLRCPPTRGLGCAGDLALRLPWQSYPHVARPYVFGPGKRRTLTFRLSRRQGCRLAAARVRRVTVELSGTMVQREPFPRRTVHPRLARAGHQRDCQPRFRGS